MGRSRRARAADTATPLSPKRGRCPTFLVMVRRLLLSLLPLLSLLGCATPRGKADLLGTPEIRTVTAGSVNPAGQSVATTFRYEEQSVVVEELMDGGVERVLPALLAAVRSEGLIPDDVDAESGIVTLSGVEWSRERNGERLSVLLDCGSSGTGRPMADDARIVAALAAQAKEAGPGAARVTVRLSAAAYPYESLGGRVRECVTTGELEHSILSRVRVALASAPADSGATDGTLRAAPPPAASPAVPIFPALGATLGMPLSAGDRLRIWLGPGERVTGVFLQVRADSLVLGTGRRTPIPLAQIRRIQVKRTRPAAVVVGAVVGIAAGVAIATTTDWGIVGKHEIQGKMLNPGLGALAGGVAGILLANSTFGASWVEVPVGVPRIR